MATSIRLKRVGSKKEASYRIIVTDSREGTSGAAIERLGQYNPRTKPSMIQVNAARTLYWLNEGAEPSDTVRSLLQKTGVWKQFHDGVTAETVEQEIVFIGPPEGERGTSQRPMPTDRKPKAVEAPPAPAPEAPPAEEAAPAEAAAEEAPAEAEEAP
ncbi:MAG: 30S ribosomal protein S16, partial [Gemmatimonadota bacterium]